MQHSLCSMTLTLISTRMIMRIRSEHCAISKPIETDSVHMVLEDNAFLHQFVPNLFF